MTRSPRSGLAGPAVLGATLSLLLSILPGSGLGTVRAADPPSDTITPTGPAVEWDGTGIGGGAAGEGFCEQGVSCDDFALTVSGTAAAWAGKQLKISITWLSPSTDYDMVVHKGTLTGPVAGSSGNGATTSETVTIVPAESGAGGQVYTVNTIYFAATAADQYQGTARVETVTTPPPPPPATGIAPRYQNYVAPPTMGNSAGEPTLGVNTATGNIMYIAGLETLRVGFDDCSSPARATWEDVSAPNTSLVSLDPILWMSPEFGDPGERTCRTIASQLFVKSSNSSYSDDDGDSWTPSQGSGINSGADHQNIGGGRFADPAPPHTFPYAVYYCAQDIADANCALSVDGGQTYGPGVPVYTALDCNGLHGHIKVGPNDGTAYLPNKVCNGQQGVIVSPDNGVTWDVRRIPDSTEGDWDPSVDIGAGGRVYFGYSAANGHAMVATSADKGLTWTPSIDVGAIAGIKDIAFPAMVAGDNNRAAFAFLGTTSAAGSADAVWHLYIAHTYNSGANWTLVDATPDDPVQRGTICSGGISCGNDRNLLDFMDAVIDARGRVLVSYADGCIDGCVLAPPNSFAAKATIARQSGGRGLFAAFDVPEPTVPDAPLVTSTRDSDGIHLTWDEPDNGGAPITSYRVYRSESATSGFSLVATVTNRKYDDFDVASGTPYYYRVRAVNSVGQGAYCQIKVNAALTVSESPCDPPGLTILQDANNDFTLPAYAVHPQREQFDIRRLSIGEPYFSDGSNKVVFTLKMDDLSGTLSPSTTWPINFYNSADPAATGRYVLMRTNAASAVFFEYGTVVRNSDGTYGARTKVGDLDAGSGYQADGTITLIASASKIGNPGVGATLSGFLTRVQVGAPTPDNMPDNLSPGGTYTRVGNAFCRPNNAPTALLTATPQQGVAPLQVAFDARGSSDPDGDAITQYRYNFGDGTPLLVTGDPTVNHTYAEPGEYRAILTVKDERGLSSSNQSFRKIVVEDTPGPDPTLSINNVSKLEGDSGYTDFVFTVTRTGDLDESSAVRYHTESGTAKVPQDYVAIDNATLSFGPGTASRTITVKVVGDGKKAPDDTFFVKLTDPTGATISDGSGMGTILNDDPFLRISDVTVDEPASGSTRTARFTVTLSYPTTTTVTVHWRTRNGTATAPSDYTAVTDQTLTFSPGQTTRYARVTIKFNTPTEPDERFFVDLFNASGARIDDGTGRGTIRD